MTRSIRLFLTAVFMVTMTMSTSAQNPPVSQEQAAQAEKAFETGNALMDQRKHAEALVQYKQALAVMPREPALLFNGGMAAFASKDFTTATDLWKKLKGIEPSDWHVRAKLVQAYQALGKLSERDAERGELFEMWKTGKPAELREQIEYCRDQLRSRVKK